YIGKPVGTVHIRIGLVQKATIPVEVQDATAWVVYQYGRQDVTVEIIVIGKHARCRYGNGCIFRSGVQVLVGYGSVIYTANLDYNGCNIRQGQAIACLVGERVDSMIPGIRRVSKGPVALKRQGAVQGSVNQDC